MRKQGNEQTLCNGNGQIWARLVKRKRRHLGRIGNIKNVQNNGFHVPEESRGEMDVEKSKRCDEHRN